MSSTLRSVAQIPARIKYLVAVASPVDSSDNILADECVAFSTDLDLATMIPHTEVPTEAVVAPEVFAPGDLFKDLGRQVIVYDAATSAHLIVYRQVQRVNGANDEGVPGNYNVPFYIRVWAASGAGVLVARTGPGAH